MSLPIFLCALMVLFFFTVYFETTDIAVAATPFTTDTWKGFSFISPNLKELHTISKALQGESKLFFMNLIRLFYNFGVQIHTKYLTTFYDEIVYSIEFMKSSYYGTIT